MTPIFLVCGWSDDDDVGGDNDDDDDAEENTHDSAHFRSGMDVNGGGIHDVFQESVIVSDQKWNVKCFVPMHSCGYSAERFVLECERVGE